MPLFNNLDSFYHEFQLPLARTLYAVSKRGLLTKPAARYALQSHVETLLYSTCNEIEKLVGKKVSANATEQHEREAHGVDSINLGSTKQLIELLKSRGLKVPTSRQTGRATTSEAKLFELYSKSGDEVLKHVLSIREYNGVYQNFLHKNLWQDVFYSDYVVGGTVTGRRSSRQNIFGLGSNGQNIPKHSELAKLIRACFVARPGKIYAACDQKGAEDWIVQALIVDNGGSRRGYDELLAGINRHRKLAAFIFGKPESEIDKAGIPYYLGKRTRHANNYGIRGAKLSFALASERILVPERQCDYFLEKTNELEPDVRRVFQKYIETTLMKFRKLQTPIGRVREFYSLRPFSDNGETFREGYAYIPQSTVGDNTGLAIVSYESQRSGEIVGESHDSIITEVDDNVETVRAAMSTLAASFHRTLRFERGFEIEIPIEFEIGYSLDNMKTVTPETLSEVYTLCQEYSEETGSASMSVPLLQSSKLQMSSSGGPP